MLDTKFIIVTKNINRWEINNFLAWALNSGYPSSSSNLKCIIFTQGGQLKSFQSTFGPSLPESLFFILDILLETADLAIYVEMSI